ncbi:UNVERIFIED_CONTAM: hypothetical protein Slati_2453200 [Sesamum latifolium]|uniref:DUF4283 domain-containing protein n=1 Tax=Sesamum latifolium TaxID=2727402 RepID=A0AAW2WDF9_9LAMI
MSHCSSNMRAVVVLRSTIVLQKWELGMMLQKLQHTQVPEWIKLRHLPVELWTNEGLSTVSSGIGKPLYPDAITRACTRLNFARVCVMLDISSKLPKHIVIMVPCEMEREGMQSGCGIRVAAPEMQCMHESRPSYEGMPFNRSLNSRLFRSMFRNRQWNKYGGSRGR